MSFSTTEAPHNLTANVITGIGISEAAQQYLAVNGTNPATIPIALQPGSYKLSFGGQWSQGSAEYAVNLEVGAGASVTGEPSEAPPTTSCIYLSATTFTCDLGNGRVRSGTP